MTSWQESARLKLRMFAIGLGVAIAYALLCWAARHLSIDQFYLPAGIRVAALILVPKRLWPYLFLGEYTYFAEMRLPLIDKYGLAWVVLGSAALMPAVALVVHGHLKRIEVASGVWLLSTCALSALIVTGLNVSLSELLWDVASPIPVGTRFLRYAVGDYVGMLTVVPFAMLWKNRAKVPVDDAGFFGAATVAIGLMFALGAVAVALPDGYELVTPLLQLTMAVPAIALTCSHGWKGAALTVPMLNLLVGLASSPWSQPYWAFDLTLFSTQQILAIAGTAMLCMGSTISHHYHEHLAGSRKARLTVAHAKTAHLSAEMELRKRALSMRKAAERTDHVLSEIGHLLSEKGSQAFADDLMRVAVATSRTLRDQTSMVYPTALEHVGLYLTLQISGISREWESTCRVLPPRFKGDPCRLTVGLQLAAYRALTEAVSLLLGGEYGSVRLHARCGRARGRQGVVMLISLADRSRSLKETTRVRMTSRMTGGTLAYQGSVICRRGSVRIVLSERATARTAVEHELNLDPAASVQDAAGMH